MVEITAEVALGEEWGQCLEELEQFWAPQWGSGPVTPNRIGRTREEEAPGATEPPEEGMTTPWADPRRAEDGPAGTAERLPETKPSPRRGCTGPVFFNGSAGSTAQGNAETTDRPSREDSSRERREKGAREQPPRVGRASFGSRPEPREAKSSRLHLGWTSNRAV